jgi:hypothetical protein
VQASATIALRTWLRNCSGLRRRKRVQRGFKGSIPLASQADGEISSGTSSFKTGRIVFCTAGLAPQFVEEVFEEDQVVLRLLNTHRGGIYAKVNISDNIKQQRKANPSITPAELNHYFDNLYQDLLDNLAISGLVLQVHWNTLNPNPPAATGPYDWSYVDDAFSEVACDSILLTLVRCWFLRLPSFSERGRDRVWKGIGKRILYGRGYCEIDTGTGGLHIIWSIDAPPQTVTLTVLPVRSGGRIRSTSSTPNWPGAGPA